MSTPRHRAAVEFGLVALTVLAAFLVALRIDLDEERRGWMADNERWHVDELAVAGVVACLGLAVLAWRRHREALAEARQRTATERELARRNLEYKSLFDNHISAVFSLDTEGNYTAANTASEDLGGYPFEELREMSFADVVLAEDLPATMVAFERALGGEPQAVEIRIRHKAGHVVDVALVGLPIVVDPEEGVVGVYGIAEDVTERNRLYRALADARASAERANEAKSTFLANVSHEIRTPLTSVLGTTELLLDTVLDETQERLLHTIDRSGHRLLRLVNEILDFSRIEAGHLEVQATDYEPRRIVSELGALVEAQARRKGIALLTEVDDEVPDRLHGDPLRLAQVVGNLLDNAVKFTTEGRVRLAVSVPGTDPGRPATADHVCRASGGPRVTWVVDDTGIGIAPAQHEQVFEAFNQADATVTRKYGGTGLGLTISRQLAGSMGGSLHLESTPDRGSRFTLCLPLH